MKFKTAQEVIECAKQRGFEVNVNPGPPPMPFLRCPNKKIRSNATDALMGALRAWRVEIIELLTEKAK
jgi:hypothetical protein